MSYRQIIYGVVLCMAAVCINACSDDELYDYEPFRIDMVTCRTDDGTLSFIRDDGRILVPKPAVAIGNRIGDQRVLINYVENRTGGNQVQIVRIKSLGDILYGNVFEISSSLLDKLADDPIYLITVWEGGSCINLRYKIEYHSVAHFLQLYYAPEEQRRDDTLRLQLRHDRRDDPPGYLTQGYASFRYSGLPGISGYKAVKIFMNTSNVKQNQYIFALEN